LPTVLAYTTGAPEPLLLVGWRDIYSKQVAQRIHGYVNLAATPGLVAVIGRTRAALATGLQGAPIHHHSSRRALATLRNTDDGE